MTREKTIVKTSIIGILGNVLLVTGKIIVGILASSASIISDAVNNLTDALSSIVTIIGTKLSVRRPDKKHPYGHGRIEFVTSSLIGMVIFVAGVMAIYESIESLIRFEEPTYDVISFVIISVAIAVKIVLGLFFKHEGKLVDSGALKAGGTDALMDSILSFGTLVGAVISYTTGVHLEGYIGIVIGLLIVKSSLDVLKESISQIIGERTDPEFAANIKKAIAETDGVFGVYDLIINNYGTDRNIGSVHVEVADDMTAKEIQRLEREIGYLCYEKFHTIMTVGVYAKNAGTEEDIAVKTAVSEIIAKHTEIIQTHGFYVDLENKTISVDIVITFDCKEPDNVYKAVCEEITTSFPEFTLHLILDKDFTE